MKIMDVEWTSAPRHFIGMYLRGVLLTNQQDNELVIATTLGHMAVFKGACACFRRSAYPAQAGAARHGGPQRTWAWFCAPCILCALRSTLCR